MATLSARRQPNNTRKPVPANRCQDGAFAPVRLCGRPAVGWVDLPDGRRLNVCARHKNKWLAEGQVVRLNEGQQAGEAETPGRYRRKDADKQCQYVTPGTNARCWSPVMHAEPGELPNRYCGRHAGYMLTKMRSDGYLQPVPVERGPLNPES